MPYAPKTHHQRRKEAGLIPPRLSASARGYGRQWQKVRAVHLQEHPLCVECEKEGIVRPADHVDHVKPVNGKDDPLFFEPSNLQSLCLSHHSRKTAKEDGGYGNPGGRPRLSNEQHRRRGTYRADRHKDGGR